MSCADLAQLSDLVVTGRVSSDPEVLVGFASPERGRPGLAKYLVEPGGAAELSGVASWAFRERQRLVIQGANSGLVEASTPDRSGEQGVLGLGRMAKLIDFEPSEGVAVVEAGIRLQELNEALGEADQMFPIELGSNPTIGGMLATNAGGAHTIRYGDTGSRLLALEAVLADAEGRRIGSPSVLRKDNSRLKLDRLFVGSYGSLGVISRAAIRTAKRPRSVATAIIVTATHHSVLEIFTSFESAFTHAVSAFEFMSPETVMLAQSTLPDFRPPVASDGMPYVLLEVESDSLDAADLESSLADHLGVISASRPDAVVDAVILPPREAWGMRHVLAEGVMRAGATVRFDVSVPRANLPQLRDFVIGRFSSDTVIVSEFGHWADGGTHIALVYLDQEIPPSVHGLRQELYDEVVLELGGSFSSEHGLGRHNAAFYERYVPEAERTIAGQLKGLLDPRHVWGTAPFR